jgi:hypothetical protein
MAMLRTAESSLLALSIFYWLMYLYILYLHILTSTSTFKLL